MRVALVHDWLTGMRGGEKVLACLCRLLPQANIFTLIHLPGSCPGPIERHRIIPSALNDLPGVRRYYRYLLPLMPRVIEQLNLSGYDLVISCSHCVAKGVICPQGSLHICYCLTPMRYAWSGEQIYRSSLGLSGLGLRVLRPYLRAWDLRSSRRVDYFLADSRNVAGRIQQTYRRDAPVLYPPIDTKFFTPDSGSRQDFYLMVTALAPYKRVDQAIDAFARLNRPLKIIGTGQQLASLRRMASGNVQFVGWQSDEIVRENYRRCRAVVFPGEEDFGLVPLEAMACGSPVIAYGAGGALETVVDVRQDGPSPPTGLLYRPQTVEGLIEAVKRFEQSENVFQPPDLAAWAQRFAVEKFLSGFKHIVGSLLDAKGMPHPW